jgi:hypothetical protein
MLLLDGSSLVTVKVSEGPRVKESLQLEGIKQGLDVNLFVVNERYILYEKHLGLSDPGPRGNPTDHGNR